MSQANGSPEGPSGLESLQATIQQHLGELSQSQRSLARFVLENHSRVAFATANEVGSAVGVSGATVVRFAQLLGYEGFSDLRESLRDGLVPFPTFLEQLSELAKQPLADPTELPQLVFRWEQENLQATLGLLDSDALAEAARWIPKARRTILIGTGVGGAVVKLLAGHLARLGLPVVAPADTIEAVIAIANVGPEDVVVGVTYWRFARSTSEWLHQAKRRGARTVAIVDSPLFPARAAVDHQLVVSSRNPGHGPSAVSGIALVNALVAAIILTDFRRFYEAIERIDKAYSESHVYLE